MVTLTNKENIDLPLAVWLAVDEYDYVNEDNYISVTSLMKPVRQLVLAQRQDSKDLSIDIADLIAARMGTAIHNSIEEAWVKHGHHAMRKLGMSDDIINKVQINPEKPDPNKHHVYLERRSIKSIAGFRVGGKFDFAIDGQVQDNKSTSTFVYTNDTKADDYILQGSIYRWLNQDIIFDDNIRIHFIFTDWSKLRAMTEQGYPQKKIEHKDYPLLSLEDTEKYIKGKLGLLVSLKDTPEHLLPECTDKELWRSKPQYKYYKNPDKLTRSTKNFDNEIEATQRLYDDGKVGIIITVPGEVKACHYCPVFDSCTQKDKLITDGSLKI